MTWREEIRDKAQRLLEKIVQLGTDVSHMFQSELLRHELALLGGIDARSTLFTMTIQDATDQNNSSLVEFENAYANRVAFHNEVWNYDFYFPLYLNFPKRKARIYDLDVVKVPFNAIYAFHSRDALIDIVRSSGVTNFDLTNIPQYALRFPITANNKVEAWNKISAQFSLLRGILDYSTLSFQVNYTSGFTSRTKNEHPQWGLLRNLQENTSEFYIFRVAKAPIERRVSWNRIQRHWLEVLLHASRTRPSRSSSLNVLSDCLRLYGQAMESLDTHNCYLSLWQAAESLTRSEDSGGQTRQVINRLSWHADTYRTTRGLELSNSIEELQESGTTLFITAFIGYRIWT